jgi:hypothetical protein
MATEVCALSKSRRCVALGACFLLLPLVGCGSVDAVRTFAAERSEARESARFEKARVLCERYGFKPQTELFAQCLQAEVNQIKNRETMEQQSGETRDAIREQKSK